MGKPARMTPFELIPGRHYNQFSVTQGPTTPPGTWLRGDGVPVSEVAAMLGHADSRMAERVYAKLPADLLRDLLIELCQPAAGHSVPEAGKNGEDGEEQSRNLRNWCPGAESNHRHGD